MIQIKSGPLFRAIGAAYLHHWKISRSANNLIASFLFSVPTATMIVWMASRPNDPFIFTYVAVGVLLLSTWNSSVLRIGFGLANEQQQQTLEFSLTSRTPLMAIMLGKTLALLMPGLLSGLGALASAFLIAGHLIRVNDPAVFFGSLVVALISLVAITFIFVPLFVVVGGRAGFFGAVTAFGMVFSGFVHPVSALPDALRVFAYPLPTSWAMEGIGMALRGDESIMVIAGRWGLSLALSAVYSVVTFWLFRIVDKRVRITGVLGTS